MPEYKVDLDVYNGPLDLLLFLIRRDEVDIYDIPIAKITEQYIAFVSLIERLDPNMAADFLVLAATLMEIKSRTLLPRPPIEEEDDDFGDPRLELVRQLLEYKKYKDVAHALGAALELQTMKHKREPVTPALDSDQVDLDEVQVWDLFEAFRKLLEATGKRHYKHEVVYDDTPIALHAADILDALERADGSQPFQALFEGRTKAQLIGLFLALLELIRQKRVRALQNRSFGVIELHLLDASPIRVDEARDYASRAAAEEADAEDDALDAEDAWADEDAEPGFVLHATDGAAAGEAEAVDEASKPWEARLPEQSRDREGAAPATTPSDVGSAVRTTPTDEDAEEAPE